MRVTGTDGNSVILRVRYYLRVVKDNLCARDLLRVEVLLWLEKQRELDVYDNGTEQHH